MVPYKIESWIWFSVVMIVAISRIISRRMALGSFKRFQADEYIMTVILCFYTTLVVTTNIIAHTSSNLLPPGYDIANMTEQDIQERIFGSKLILVVEESQIVSVWGVKACLLCMYLRLTTLRRENIAVKILAAYVAITFIIMEGLYLGYWCQPFSNYWAVPTPNPQCNTATNHLILNAVFNLTSDTVMLAIGLPMFLRLKIPWTKKAPLVGVFSLGVFVIVAAILNKVYSFSEPFGSAWIYWYVRESSTAIIVANLPFIWLLYRKIFGIRSANGTRTPGYESDVYETSSRVRGKKRVSKVPGRDMEAADKNDADLELGESQRRSGSLTMEEMLRGNYAVGGNDKEVTPFTHPALFYGSGARRSFAMPQAPADRAVLSDTKGQETVRRDSLPEKHTGTPTSSQFISKSSPKSTGSFV